MAQEVLMGDSLEFSSNHSEAALSMSDTILAGGAAHGDGDSRASSRASRKAQTASRPSQGLSEPFGRDADNVIVVGLVMSQDLVEVVCAKSDRVWGNRLLFTNS